MNSKAFVSGGKAIAVILAVLFIYSLFTLATFLSFHYLFGYSSD